MIGLGPIQPTIAQRANGDLVALCRDSGRAPGRVMRSVSQDGGETWSLARDTDLPNPGSSLAVVTLRDGRWALVYNDTEDGRHQLAVSLSENEGETWPWKRYLDAAEPGVGSFSYPTAIEAKDGRVHVTYSYRVEGGAAIKHAAFDPDWTKGHD
jgi:predicted neuraminidase